MDHDRHSFDVDLPGTYQGPVHFHVCSCCRESEGRIDRARTVLSALNKVRKFIMGKLEDSEANLDASNTALEGLANAVNTLEDELKAAVAQGKADAETVDRILAKSQAAKDKAAAVLADASSRDDDEPTPPA